jgi:hypothetical protein
MVSQEAGLPTHAKILPLLGISRELIAICIGNVLRQ